MAIEVIDIIKQKNGNTFPLIDCNDLLGGFYQVETISLRNSIPSQRRKENMLCHVKEDDITYQLKGGIQNSNWSMYSVNPSDFENLKAMVIGMADQINDLQQRVLELESSSSRMRAICGDFVSGEVFVGQNLTEEELAIEPVKIERYESPNVTSSLSDKFKQKLIKVEIETEVGEDDGI